MRSGLVGASEIVAGAFQGTVLALCGLFAIEGLNRGAALNHLSVAPLLWACVILGILMYASSARVPPSDSRLWDAAVSLGLAAGAMGICLWTLRAYPEAWPLGAGIAGIAAALALPGRTDLTRRRGPPAPRVLDHRRLEGASDRRP